MSRIDRPATAWLAACAIGVTVGLAACTPAAPSTPSTANGQERMPAPASIWITSEPPAPTTAVNVELTDAQDATFHRTHTFQAGEVLRGSIPVSSGHYRLVALGGTCALDVFLGPQRETDVVIALGVDGGCDLTVVREHGEEVSHDGPEVLID